ncbi:MAG: DUF1499 domain-containing protein [Nevskiaceae bacterium]|nr:MAG: DUF1499 domain-containing protein [Nevskiaceae bacterium]
MYRTLSAALISGCLLATAAAAQDAATATAEAAPAPGTLEASAPSPSSAAPAVAPTPPALPDAAAAPAAPAAPATEAAVAAPVVHRIAPCEGGPYCVSSTSYEEGRHIAPIRYGGSDAPAQQAMLRILSGMGEAKVVEVTPGYIHAAFPSLVPGLSDDLEMLFANHLIQVRSSRRTAVYDFGANRNRVEALRKAFEDIQP